MGGTYPRVTTEVLEDGWIRIKINLSEATPQGNANPSFVSRIEIKATTTGSDYTTASGYIKYMGIVE